MHLIVRMRIEVPETINQEGTEIRDAIIDAALAGRWATVDEEDGE